MANKKRIATSVAAVATAAALLLGGTFAWQSVNQTALNEASDVINPGGRLHDDFNGSNKDVYVENFAEEEIFARVRLDEYFEITMNKGTPVENNEIVTVGAVKDDVDTYVTHQFDEANATDDYWTWTTGGETIYMPTFNLNKDSLQADINGTYAGPDGTDGENEGDDADRYGDYHEYYDGEEKMADATYDADANNIDEIAEGTADVDVNYKKVPATHYATTTANASLMSMDEWQALSEEDQIGDYWVYDDDGWVYYAKPIPAGTATGLLLDGIELNQVMDDSWYYAINVVAQFVTADDLGKTDGTGFYDTEKGTVPSAAALELLEAIGVDVSDEEDESGDEELGYIETLPAIDFKNEPTESDSVTVYRGTTYEFGYSNTAWGGTWDVWADDAKFTSDGDDHTSTTSTHPEYGTLLLHIAADEPNDTLLCTVTFSGDGGEDCYASIYFNVKDPATPDDVDTLKEALDNGGMIYLDENTFTTDEDADEVIPNFDGSTTADYVWTEGGTVNGGALTSTSGSSHTLFINNENNWPVTGDGANAATMNGTDITSGSRFAIYAQAVDAPITLNDMNITNNYGGGILAEYTQPITLNNLTVYAASLDDDYAWVNSALAAGMGADITINGGSYTGENAVYLLSSGATVTINGGTFTGALTVENGTLVIQSGTFTADPTAFVDAENYDVTDNGNGTWTVSEKAAGGEESTTQPVPSYIKIWSSCTDIENTEPAATISESGYWKDPANSGEYWFRIYDENGNAINDAVISGDYYSTETTAITDFAATSEWQDDNFTAPYYSWLAQSATGGEIIVTIGGEDYYFGVEMEY